VASVTFLCVEVCLSVSLCVCVRTLKRKRLELSTPNLVYINTVYGIRSACVDPEVKRSEFKVARLRIPSLSYSCCCCCGRYATAAGVGLHVVRLLWFLVYSFLYSIYMYIPCTVIVDAERSVRRRVRVRRHSRGGATVGSRDALPAMLTDHVGLPPAGRRQVLREMGLSVV